MLWCDRSLDIYDIVLGQIACGFLSLCLQTRRMFLTRLLISVILRSVHLMLRGSEVALLRGV